MAKVSGTYPSLSRGVSQQPPEVRLDGQHTEQINLWSDPVHGLGRRRGTLYQDVIEDNAFGPSYWSKDEEDKIEWRRFFASYRSIPYSAHGEDFVVHYPTRPAPAGLGEQFVGPSGGVRVSRKFDSEAMQGPYGGRIMDVKTFATSGSDPQHIRTKATERKGFSTATQVGDFLVLWPNDTTMPEGTETDQWGANTNKGIGWTVKQGIPNRTYRITFLFDGTERSYSYTTPSSAYTGVLDTSDIDYADPDYQKQVNDRVNAYNSAVTAWITTAAQQTTPRYIASSLGAQIAVGAPTIGGYLAVPGQLHDHTALFINTSRAKNPASSDGGDGTSIQAWGDTVENLDQLPPVHNNNGVIRVKPKRDGEAAFYMKATTTGTLNPGPVSWAEAPRQTAADVENPALVLAFGGPAANQRVAMAHGDAVGKAWLETLLSVGSGSLKLPQFNWRLVGDSDTSPQPGIFGKQITWMGTFQDRLCMAAGNVVCMSEIGNYFQFWRTETLTVPDTDPVEVFALGSETDTIRHSVIFDRSLLLFGDSHQYSIDGRVPVTPATSSIIQSSTIPMATDAPPVEGGSLVFFGKRREGSTEIYQMDVGDVADTSRITGLGLQLMDYLPGRPAQILYVASPETLFVRTVDAPHSIFVFRFIDQNGERLMDSWSRFDFHPAFGLIYAMYFHEDSLYLRVQREAWEGHLLARGAYGTDNLERLSLVPTVGDFPYLDSMRPAEFLWMWTGRGWDFSEGGDFPYLHTAFCKSRQFVRNPGQHPTEYWLHGAETTGRTLSGYNALFQDLPGHDVYAAVIGIPFESSVKLTSPVRRSENGQPVMQNRLTVRDLQVYYKDSGGLSATVSTKYGLAKQYQNYNWVATDTAYGVVTALSFNGRQIGDVQNMVGVIPVTSGSMRVFVGREGKEYACTLSSRTWMPLTITRISWTGQTFMNHRHW